MKIYVKAEDDSSRIPTLDEYLSEVDSKDKDIINYLMNVRTFNGKLFTSPSTRNELGKTQDYSPKDKVIHLIKTGSDYRIYDIPYTGRKFPGVVGIFTFPLTIYDDSSFQFGDGKIRQIGQVSDNTLSNDVMKARV